MTPNSLKHMVACGFIDEIIITSFPEYFTISFLTTYGAAKQMVQYLSYDDRKGGMKHFHSAKSLHAKITEILAWPVNSDRSRITSIHINFFGYTSLDRSSSNNDN